MKILFVDQSSNVQQKWIEPLRAEGWGVVRARSAEDAEKILEFHGDSLDAVVVSESFVEWAEKWNYLYVVLTSTWKEMEIIKHQNSSAHAAVAYLGSDSTAEQLKLALTGQRPAAEQELKSTGTEGISLDSISLDQYDHQPSEIETTGRKKDAPAVQIAPEKVAEQKDTDKTVMLELTNAGELNLSHDVENFINEKPEVEAPSETVSFEEPVEVFSPAPEMRSAVTVDKDLETMKNYLALREQDVAVLTGQLRSAQERIQQMELQMKVEKSRSAELQHLVQKQEQQIKNYDREKQVEFEVLYQQVEDVNLQLRERTDKARAIEAKLKITTDEVEKVKERVRVDIRRIRVREKELEGQLEVLKKDSTALLVARDEKILELKRKLDLLEFNMELVQEQYSKERETTEQLRHKLKEASTVMKRAGGLLDQEN